MCNPQRDGRHLQGRHCRVTSWLAQAVPPPLHTHLEAALAVEGGRGQAEGRGHGADAAEGVVLPHGHRDGQAPGQRLRADARRHARAVVAYLS